MGIITLIDILLVIAGAWALERLMRASNDLCRGNPYARPDDKDR